MKTYEAFYNPEENKGVFAVSLVLNPAMEGDFIALKAQSLQLKEIDSEQRILVGLVLEPNKPIYRNQNGEEFNITFSENTIKELSYGFFKNNHQKNSTIEHDESQKIEGVTFVESWIVEDSKNDKSNALGLSYPKGSWIATMKVDNDNVWSEFVKTGKVKGFSIDAMLSLEEVNLKSEINMSVEIIEMLKNLPTSIALALKPKVDIKLGSVKSADGSVVIEYEGDMMMEGGAVFVVAEDGTQVPLPVGDYELEDGMILSVTEEGKIGSMKAMEAPAAENVDAPLSEPNVPSATDQATAVENAIKSIMIKYAEEFNAKLKAVTDANVVLKAEIVALSAQPATKPKVSVPTQLGAQTAYQKFIEHKNKFN
jgi:hypothetical protein